MNKTALSIVLALSCAMSFGAELNLPYQPTRAEWLGLTVRDAVRTRLELWRLRVSVGVVVAGDGTEVLVTLTESNGEPRPTERVQADYVQSVRAAVESVLQRYPWSSGMKVRVQFV